jgi:ABC-type protease/lipase transport system fused ATPase/permease subunit
MVTHRAPLLAGATRLLLLANGTVSMFGEYQEVLAALQRSVPKPALVDAEGA